jgi:hypothetical protein
LAHSRPRVRLVPVVQNLPHLRKHFDEDFKNIGHLMQPNVKIE